MVGLMEGILSADSANGELWVMDVISILLGIALIVTIAGMVVCHIERFQDIGRGLTLPAGDNCDRNNLRPKSTLKEERSTRKSIDLRVFFYFLSTKSL